MFTPSEAEDSGTALKDAIDEFDVVHELVNRAVHDPQPLRIQRLGSYVPPTPEEWRNLSGPEGERIHRSVLRSPDEPVWATRRNAQAERLRVELDDREEIDRRLASWIELNPPPRGNVGDVADHIDHIREVAGIDHIGIGSDF